MMTTPSGAICFSPSTSVQDFMDLDYASPAFDSSVLYDGVQTSRKASGSSSIGDLHFGIQQGFQSISAEPLFETTSHEELRWSYYHSKYQARPNPPVQQFVSFWRQSNKPQEEPSQPTFSCPICMEKMDEIYSTICGHVFCQPCINAAIRAQNKCPTCRKQLREGQFLRVFLP